jgi:hypothetical protein
LALSGHTETVCYLSAFGGKADITYIVEFKTAVAAWGAVASVITVATTVMSSFFISLYVLRERSDGGATADGSSRFMTYDGRRHWLKSAASGRGALGKAVSLARRRIMPFTPVPTPLSSEAAS